MVLITMVRGDYSVVQLLIEDVSGMPYDEYMKEEVLLPLGMNNSTFAFDDVISNELAKPYGVFGQEMTNYLYVEKAAAGLYSSASDLARLGIATLSDVDSESQFYNAVLSDETIELMTVKETYAKWGLGYNVFTLDERIDLVGHTGSNRGWKALFLVMPDEKQGIVVLTNGDYGESVTAEVAAYWMKSHTGELPSYYHQMHNMNIAIKYGAWISLLVLFLIMTYTLNKGRNKSRFDWKSKESLKKNMIKSSIPVIILVIWWVGLYGPIDNGWRLITYLPYNFKWVSLAVSLWCVVLFVLSLFPKQDIGMKV